MNLVFLRKQPKAKITQRQIQYLALAQSCTSLFIPQLYTDQADGQKEPTRENMHLGRLKINMQIWGRLEVMKRHHQWWKC
jgi:hypothetical protein